MTAIGDIGDFGDIESRFYIYEARRVKIDGSVENAVTGRRDKRYQQFSNGKVRR
jgi:hypothetical protein